MEGGTPGTEAGSFEAGSFETGLDDIEAEGDALRERLQQAEARAAAAEERARRELATVATVGHELRNPLSVIATGIEVLRSQPPTAAVLTNDRTIRIVRDQVRHMTRLLDDLLRARREAAMELDLWLVPVAISGLVEQAVLAVDERLRSRSQVLAVQLPEHEVRVRADAQRLQQVLVNLLDNASKYTGDGGRLGLVVEAEPHACVLRVWDEGIGIGGDEVERIRSMFTQGRGLPGRERSGMGIGLALAGRIVELHGGTLEIVSRDQGRPLGTEIVVRLSRELAPSARRPATAPQG
jgi:signal transduction histidine kinase